MKKLLKILLIVLSILYLFSSCNLTDPVSASERLTKFESSINSDSRTSTYTNIHSGVSTYNQMIASTYWDTQFLQSEQNYSFSVTMSAEVSGIITGTGTLYHSSSDDTGVIIEFKENEDDVWYIYSYYDGTTQLF
jgi:hypothetical protein